MTRTLILMRHAKSSWDDFMQPDHDRPLNKRGIASARALGDWLRGKGYIPDKVISSSATRTQETFDGLNLSVTPEYTHALYHAGAEKMLDVLQGAQGACVLMLGHNPGIADFVERLVNASPAHARFLDYPTGATTVIRFDVENWRAVRFGQGTVQDFVIPRELPEV
jgi:phosphohistidine phosphatase